MLLVSLFLVSLSGVSAANQTINSTSTGGIAQGITNTGTGETLFLQPGIYNKTNQDINIHVNKNITIKGNGSKGSVIIDARKISGIFSIGNNVNVTFINIKFCNGYSTSNGGAIYNPYANTIMSFINCTFANNTGRDGGAIYNYGSNIIIINNNFINSYATSNGGAIYNYGANAIINNNNFTNNTAISNDGGGAIHNYGANINITNNNFINNNAANTAGGAIMTAGPNTIIFNNSFINNTSVKNGAGAIFVGVLAVNTIISNNNFIANKGLIGGALVISGTQNCSVINNNFINNIAFANGGAIYNRGNNTSVSNNTFIGNSATDIGGAIFNNVIGNMSVSNNIMLNNSANLGQMIYNNGSMGVLNLTFINNSTWIVKNGSTITLFATLTDDMGNTVTGQNISFYIDGVFLANVTSIEGEAKLNYLVNQEPNSIIPVTGDYEGHTGYSIMIKNGELLIKTIPKEPEEKENPEDLEISEDPKINNKTSNNNPTIKTSSATMKPTGMPIIALSILLISAFGLIIRSKK
ncbi:adhesin-like protein [Methanobrevibacter arboriphilus JCM 13429 = DSM 1125]|uniref:Adhesin-like protein n=2 Tax=Methanobrevibacter arboriphilus TaxID=39441 RepID=A0A1V6N2E4_METAZ|nr:hypothetical protein [Methanobrevibacter arboriphilus]OQD58824.1 adhesin-like protein [Methanobrevibacter arboriphilus JCM 13429 = DSM 1125]